VRIPTDIAERQALYAKVVQQCLRSQQDREEIYKSLRNLYLFGSSSGEPAKFNKIHPHEELVASYLYSQDTTYFAVRMGISGQKADDLKLNVLNRYMNDLWVDTSADAVVGEAVLWSLVYNTVMVKLVWINGQLQLYFIEPHLFGVYREDIQFLDDQEAVVHVTYITKTELESRLVDHPRREDILRSASIVGRKEEVTQPISPIQQIIISSLGSNVAGNVSIPEAQLHQYVPEYPDEMIEVRELWIWDDDANDYRTVTFVEPDVYIYERTNIFVAHELPFVKVTPIPLHNYFWGESEVQHLQPLQELRETRLKQLGRLFEKQVDPPKAATGMSGIIDEKLAALNDPGGFFADTGIGQGKIEEFKPSIPQDPYGELREIDEMFIEVSGIVPILQGRGEKGVRAQNQASKMAQLAASRPRRRALIVEDSLEKIATLMLKICRQESDKPLVDDQGGEFLLASFTDDFVVKVSAHSSSPVFVEDQKSIAFELHKRGIISKRTLVEIVHPAHEEIILHRLPEIEQADAQRSKIMMEAEALRIRERGMPLGKGAGK
jgi:hypothetical protein